MSGRSLNWLKVTVHHPPVAGEALSALLFDEGAQGVWEDLPDARGRPVSRAGFGPEERARLEKTLPVIVARLAEAFDLPAGDFDFRLELEESHDWAEKWKEGLAPVIISPALALAPTWWPADDLPEAAVILRLDPGLAFGSGHHATTFLCLKLLVAAAPAARRILDVGAGSGILSLAAAACAPEAEVIGVDNDPDTIEVARENAELNNLGRRVSFSGRDLAELQGTFDLIVANITLGPLTELAPAITRLAESGGGLILSGLLDSQAEEAAEVYAALGWNLARRLDRDEWSALLFAKSKTK
ncbi:50S ribosomal protein L11 methyltransferase [Deltaproteobacteria bacterium OttesenSCG-928-M10]|nr:50S ribosomal protein L11 methyltransferase [Deltaproteobacteria bacterium OttesenSCG-928-M10]